MARKPRPGFRFPGPVPKEALEFFKAKRLHPSFSHLDVSAEEHALGFTVAKSAGYDILGDVRDALEKHLREGGTLRTFERELAPILREKEWWGRQNVVDPETGDPVSAQLGSPRRLRTIFRANMRSARAAGQWERIQRTKRTHPYLLYRLGPSENHRPEHVAWDGTLLPADDPWWADHMPPNGWGCKCWVRQVSEAEAQRLGGVSARPPRDEVEWTNPRTGITRRVDRGLDPSWASNPGRDRPELLAAMLARGVHDLGELSETLAREEVARIVDSPLLERQLAGRGGTGDLPAGYLDKEWREALSATTRVVRLTPATAAHQRDDHPEIALAQYRTLLPDLLHDADLVYRETARKRSGVDLVFAREFGGKLWRLAIRRHGAEYVRMTTVHRIQARNLKAAARRMQGDELGLLLRDRRGWLAGE